MGQPKKQSSMRKTGTRRSHLLLDLARRVNATSPVKVRTTKRETGKKLAAAIKAVTATKAAKPAKAVKSTKTAAAK